MWYPQKHSVLCHVYVGIDMADTDVQDTHIRQRSFSPYEPVYIPYIYVLYTTIQMFGAGKFFFMFLKEASCSIYLIKYTVKTVIL